MKRRQFLGIAGLFALPMRLFAKDLNITPYDVEGPFYPIQTIPLRSQLILDPNGLNEQIMQLKGRILNLQGKPLKGAKIEIWQCDAYGIYDHPYDQKDKAFDARFAGYGAQITNQHGEYEFTTLYPVPYTGRPPHIHVKIWLKEKTILTTQLYLQENTDGFFSRSKRELLQINPKRNENNQFDVNYIFVV